jgi:regulator of protease activity HflC (stomatin/prohibitin superfamily)
VKEFVEHYSTLNDGDDPHKVVTDAYNNLVEQPLRSIGRDEISKFDAMEIQENIGKISDAILDRVLAITKSTPFHVMSVVVGTIQYPPALSAAVADKVAETQRMQQKEIAIKTAEAEARRKEADAVGIAKANEIINKTLTPEYIQYLAVEAQSQTISGPGHTVVYIPSGPMGVPLSQVQVIPTTQDNGK